MTVLSGIVDVTGSGTLTITETGGKKVTVTTSSSTTVTVVETISLSDLAVGQQVMISGTTTDGTFTAKVIQEGARFRPGGQAGPEPLPTKAAGTSTT
jgi:hypothetical protein